jgi:hypothetical protein
MGRPPTGGLSPGGLRDFREDESLRGSTGTARATQYVITAPEYRLAWREIGTGNCSQTLRRLSMMGECRPYRKPSRSAAAVHNQRPH